MKLFTILAAIAIMGMPGVFAGDDAAIESVSPPSEEEEKSNSADSATLLRGSRNANDYFVKLKLVHNKCLSFDPRNNYYAKVEDCHAGNIYQEWYYDHGLIKSRHSNYRDWCLTYDVNHSNRYFRLYRCHGGKNQLWKYDSHNNYFRSHYDGYCMDYCRDCGHFVHGRKCESRFDHDQKWVTGHKFF